MMFLLSAFLLTAAPQDIFIEQTDNRTIVIWKDVTIPRDKEYESIVVMGGTLTFQGTTENLIVVNGKVILEPLSKVEEKLIVIHGSVQQLPEAGVPEKRGLTLNIPWQEWKENIKNFFREWKNLSLLFWIPLAGAILLALLIVFFGIAFLFFSLAPGLSQLADDTLREKPLSALGWGAVGYLAFTPLLVLLLISLVGIPLIPFAVGLALLIVLAGFFAASRAVGSFVLTKLGFSSLISATFLGVLILFSINFSPFIGPYLVFACVMAGSGAILRALFTRKKWVFLKFGR